MIKKDTSWENVSKWYDDYLSADLDSCQKQVILPNLLRLVSPKKGDRILDIACGTGYFSRELSKYGAEVIGTDISGALIDIASKSSPKKIKYFVSSSINFSQVTDNSIDAALLVMAIQNIEDVKNTFYECRRVLKKGNSFFIVMNHPAFRIPKASSWKWDKENKIQYRRVDKYLSESKEEIIMNPGKGGNVKTISFHRPIQYYFKLLDNTGFSVSRLEEWISHKQSGAGPRKKAEDIARKEIPLFLALQAVARK